VLVRNRRARPWVLGAGVALHLAIAYSIRVGFFTLAMFVLYIAFVPDDTAARLILAVRDRLRRVNARFARNGSGERAFDYAMTSSRSLVRTAIGQTQLTPTPRSP